MIKYLKEFNLKEELDITNQIKIIEKKLNKQLFIKKFGKN